MTSLPNKLSSLKKKLDKETIIAAIVLLVLAGAGIGYLVYRNHQNNIQAAATLKADKARFAQLEKDMQAAYDQMVAGLEEPLQEDEQKQCSRTSQKFEEGRLGCSVSFGVAYEVADYEDTINRFRALVSNLDGNELFKPNMKQLSDVVTDKKSPEYLQQDDRKVALSTGGQFLCSIYMRIDKEESLTDEAEGRLATYAFSCIDSLSQPVYPLAK